jgi:ATP-dependent Clp protease ATP-binding subunit ClpA
MTPAELLMQDQAMSFARLHKKTIAKRRTDRALYPPEQDPVSVFMAGSPGAGKTEASIALVNLFADTAILRIDPDELRSEFSDYAIPEQYTRADLMARLGLGSGAHQ